MYAMEDNNAQYIVQWETCMYIDGRMDIDDYYGNNGDEPMSEIEFYEARVEFNEERFYFYTLKGRNSTAAQFFDSAVKYRLLLIKLRHCEAAGKGSGRTYYRSML
jgi:hypothetical protein